MAVHRDQEGSPTGNSPFFFVARGPVPRDLHWPVMFLGPTEENQRRFFRSANTGEGQALALR